MLGMFEGEMNRQQIMAKLGLRDEKHFREHYQQAAIASGVIEMTVPDKPNSRHQKYRLTEAGKQWLAKNSKP
jgi:ATP-dependent DNA helicase RecG